MRWRTVMQRTSVASWLVGYAAAGAPVQAPVLLRTIQWLETSWFASPAIVDLDGDGTNELVGTYYSVYVWDRDFNLLDKMPYTEHHLGRIYAPAVIADLDRDGIVEIVVGGRKGRVAAYEWRDGALRIKDGWPCVTYDGAGMEPEVRSLAGADLDHDGVIEIIAANTQTDSNEPQVYVIRADGALYQPDDPGVAWTAWPRYNTATGPGNDADANGPGNHGYGCYGHNLGVGHLDDDPELEIVVTFDNHQVNVFNHDGTSHLTSDHFRNRQSAYVGNRFNWGQMIRWFDADVEEAHYHRHEGPWPHPSTDAWCQWTASPCNVVDLNLDGRNEVVGICNVESNVPYQTIHFSVMALEGNYGDGGRSARRLAGWERPPSSGPPQVPIHPWYPPAGIPSPTTVDIVGDGCPEIIAPMNDGYVYCFSGDATRLWRTDFRHQAALMYAGEVLVADLNQDDECELVFTTYGSPSSQEPGVAHGYLMVLDRHGAVLHDVELPVQGTNGNGQGSPAAPTLGDLDGDGDLEAVVQTFGGHCFVYSFPGSSTNSLPWPTGRGTLLRQGRAAPIPADTDRDRIPDWWEITHFGGPTNAVAALDPDGDGLDNADEYVADTAPDDPDSCLRWRSIDASPGVLRWQGGTRARQVVERSVNPAGQAVWTPVYTNPPPTAPTMAITNRWGALPQFFRIRAER